MVLTALVSAAARREVYIHDPSSRSATLSAMLSERDASGMARVPGRGVRVPAVLCPCVWRGSALIKSHQSTRNGDSFHRPPHIQ